MKKILKETFFDLSHYAHRSLFDQANYPWDPLYALESFFKEIELGTIGCPIPKGAILINPEEIRIGEGTVIEPGALIRGPCVIGRQCEIRHGAYLRGGVVMGDRCTIGHSTEIKGSILLDSVSAAHFNYLGDSIVGNGVNLGAGVKLANTRFDGRLIYIHYLGETISTDRQKLGAIVGDCVQMGCNSVANPGTLIGKGTLCPPCIAVSGYLPPRAPSTGKIVCQ